MRIKITVITALFALSAIMLPDTTTAQQQNEGTKNWTISAYGGISLATAGRAGGFLGDFDISSGYRPMFGGSVGYDFTPIITGQFTLFTGSFENERSADPGFSNSYLGYQVRGIVNTNNLFQAYKVSRSLNPYFFLGLGLLHSDLESDQLTRNFRTVIFTPGIGTKIYINNWVDFFIQYEMTFTRNRQLDGFAGPENNKFSAFNAGLNFSIGKRGAKLASWQIHEPGVPLTQDDVDRFNQASDRIITVESRVNDQQRRINELDSKIDTRTSDLENRVNELSGRQDNIESRLANLEQRVDDAATRTGRAPEADADGIVQSLGDGHYVQVFAATSLNAAQRVRNNTIQLMSGEASIHESRVVIVQRRQFYEVFIGVFDNFAETANVLRTAQGTYNDAFVITFPRPAHLRD